jgi:hypothetical protein
VEDACSSDGAGLQRFSEAERDPNERRAGGWRAALQWPATADDFFRGGVPREREGQRGSEGTKGTNLSLSLFMV